VENQKPRPLLQAVHCHDVMISGAGTIDGQGQPWWEKQRKFNAEARARGDKSDAGIPRARMVVFDQCERVRLEGVTLTNSPSFHLVPEQCKDVTIDGVTILAPEDSPNTDGIDPSVSSRVLITRCRIDVGDDCIALKAGHRDAGPCMDVTVTDCTFLHGHGLSIGSETTEGVRNLTVSHCTFDGTNMGIQLKSERGRGGLVENLSYSDITMKNVGQAIVITSYYHGLPNPKQVDARAPVAGTTPFWRNIRIRNVTAVDCTKDAGLIIGLPEMPAQDITLENVSISAPAGLRVRSARNVNLVNTRIVAAKGAPLLIESSVDNLRQSDSPPAPAPH
jgi:polygalacturonase